MKFDFCCMGSPFKVLIKPYLWHSFCSSMFLFISWSRRTSTGRFNSINFFTFFLSLSHFQNRKDTWHNQHRDSIYMWYARMAFSTKKLQYTPFRVQQNPRVPANISAGNHFRFHTEGPILTDRKRRPHWSKGHLSQGFMVRGWQRPSHWTFNKEEKVALLELVNVSFTSAIPSACSLSVSTNSVIVLSFGVFSGKTEGIWQLFLYFVLAPYFSVRLLSSCYSENL